MRLFDSSVFIGIFRGNPRCGRDPNHQIQRVDRLLATVETVFPIDNAIALKAAELQAQLRPRNQMLDYRDLFIAATALVNRLPLRTFNTAHFERIETLEIDNWD